MNSEKTDLGSEFRIFNVPLIAGLLIGFMSLVFIASQYDETIERQKELKNAYLILEKIVRNIELKPGPTGPQGEQGPMGPTGPRGAVAPLIEALPKGALIPFIDNCPQNWSVVNIQPSLSSDQDSKIIFCQKN